MAARADAFTIQHHCAKRKAKPFFDLTLAQSILKRNELEVRERCFLKKDLYGDNCVFYPCYEFSKPTER